MPVVDTSVFVDAERGSTAARGRIAELQLRGELAVSAVTVFELTRGSRTPPRLLRAYHTLFGREALVLPVGLLAARLAASLARALGGAPAAPDALIAGTALAHGLPLVTSDADFLRFAGLEVEWVAKPPVAREPQTAWVVAPAPAGRLAGRLRSLRRAMGARGSEVARAAGMARSNYARLESGRHAPSLATLERVAAALRVPLAALLAG